MPRAQQIKTMLSLMSRLIWTAERRREKGENEESLEIDETAAPPSVQRRYNCSVEENRRQKQMVKRSHSLVKSWSLPSFVPHALSLFFVSGRGMKLGLGSAR